MYEDYYGFVQPPFSLTPDPRFLYRSESHDIALQQVWQAIRRKEGFIVLTGDIGTGKTTLCRTILEQFDPTTFTALILNPFLSIEELLRDVLLSYGVASKDTFRTGRLMLASRHELVRTLHDFLLSLVPIHGSAVLIIDEAQHLSPEVLEEIRILSNLETNEQKLLQIVLVGQLNLLDVLHDAKLRQLDQRISIRCLLRPLNREEVEAYITHRLWIARGSTTVSFATPAIDVVHRLSGGVPRMINLLCDRALMAGCQARSAQITDTLVMEGAQALGLMPAGTPPAALARSTHGTRRRVGLAASLLTVLLGAAIIAYFVGDRIALGAAAELPAVKALPPGTLGLRAVRLPVPPEVPLRMLPPPISEGAFAVLIDTFESPRECALAEESLRARTLPLYAVDLRFPDAVRRRLFVGRYQTREEAEKLRTDLAREFPSARVVTAETELWAE
jgi:general secretion pathway protein A